MPPITPSQVVAASEDVDALIASHPVVIFTSEDCPFCTKVKKLFDDENVLYLEVKTSSASAPASSGNRPAFASVRAALAAKVSRTSVPQVFVRGKHIGGCDDTVAKHEKGVLMPLVRGHDHQYDLIVIGGGSGGLPTAKVSFGASKIFS